MNSSASIQHLGNDLFAVVMIIDDEQIIRTHDRVVFTWDMSKIDIPKQRFRLTEIQHRAYNKALFSDEGQEVLDMMKKERTELVINSFLEGYKKGVKRKESPLLKFIDEIIKQPLLGISKLKTSSIGLTKKEIYQKFVQLGLINI